MAKKYKPKKQLNYQPKKKEKYQAIGFRPSKVLVITLAILLSVGLVGSALIGPVMAYFQGQGQIGASNTYESAIEYYQGIIANNPDDIENRRNIGNTYFKWGMDYYNQGNQAGDVSMIMEAESKFMEAESQYEQVLAADPEHPANYQTLGNQAVIYFYTERTELAIETAEEVLEMDPKFYPNVMNYAIFLGNGKGEYLEAINYLEEIPVTADEYENAQNLINSFNQQAVETK